MKNSGLEKKKKNLFARIVDSYIYYKINYIFSKSYFYNFNPNPKIVNKLKINNRTLSKAKNIILNSSQPVAVIGSQIVNNKNNINYFVQNFKKLNIPVYLSSSARGVFSDEYNLQFYHNRNKALREADLIILIGITCDFRLDYGKVLNKAKIISVNLNKKHCI